MSEVMFSPVDPDRRDPAVAEQADRAAGSLARVLVRLAGPGYFCARSGNTGERNAVTGQWAEPVTSGS